MINAQLIKLQFKRIEVNNYSYKKMENFLNKNNII